MTHDERWAQMLKAYRNYILKKHRCPSKYKPEDRQLYNWIKHNRKLMNAGEMKEERVKLFQELLAECVAYGGGVRVGACCF